MRAPGDHKTNDPRAPQPAPTATFVPLRHTASQAADFASGGRPAGFAARSFRSRKTSPTESQSVAPPAQTPRPPARGAAFSPLQPPNRA